MDDDRGQLMLVGAITIAVIFLGLVAVLNTGLYTSNVAPRAGLSTTADAETFVDSVQGDVPALLGTAAEDSIDGEVYVFESTVTAEIERYEGYLLRSVGSERAATVAVSLNRTINGSGGLVVDDDPNTEFDSADDDDTDWVVARDVSDLDGRITLYRFPVHNATENAEFVLEASGSLFGGGDAWRLELYWNETQNEVHLQSIDDTGVLESCVFSQRQATNASGLTIDLTEGAVVGTDCEFPTVDDPGELGAPVSEPYDVGVERSAPYDSRAEGTYRLAVDGDIDDDNVVDGGPNVTDVPYSVPRLAAAVLDLRYTAPSLTFDTVLRVGPSTVDLPPPALTGRGVVFVNDSSGRLSTLDRHKGPVRVTNKTDAQVIGPASDDFDADGWAEVPYVTSTGAVRIVDATNESRLLTAGGEAETARSRLAVGTWNGSPVSVFYAGAGGNRIFRITPGGDPVEVVNASNSGGTDAAVGPAEVDGDGEREFVYVSAGETLHYFDIENGINTLAAGDLPSSHGGAVGQPNDFSGDGIESIPFVDGGGDLELINATDTPIQVGQNVDDAPLAVRDVNGDGRSEIVYLDNEVAYFLDGVGTGTVVDRQLQRSVGADNSTAVNASDERGVA